LPQVPTAVLLLGSGDRPVKIKLIRPFFVIASGDIFGSSDCTQFNIPAIKS
jgi:hypothetical protein